MFYTENILLISALGKLMRMKKVVFFVCRKTKLLLKLEKEGIKGLAMLGCRVAQASLEWLVASCRRC